MAGGSGGDGVGDVLCWSMSPHNLEWFGCGNNKHEWLQDRTLSMYSRGQYKVYVPFSCNYRPTEQCVLFARAEIEGVRT